MDYSLPGSSFHGESPGKNTGVGCQALLQGIFPTQGSNPGLPHCRGILYHLSQRGSPRILEWITYPVSRGSSWPRNWTVVSYIVDARNALLCTLMNALQCFGASLVAQLVKNPPAMQETWVWSLSREDPLEKGKVTHSSILAWRIPWTSPWGSKESGTTERLSLHLWMPVVCACDKPTWDCEDDYEEGEERYNEPGISIY